MIVTGQIARSAGHLNKNCWATPLEIFLPLDKEFKFTLDPCCLPETAKCEKFFTPLEDGLKQSWKNEIVFCNPPYGRGLVDKWVEKCMIEGGATTVVALLPVSTSSKWFHKYVWGKSQIRFVKGRIKFEGAPYKAPYSSMIVIWKPE